MDSDSRFHTTRWSRVLSARDASSPDAGRALAELCEAYWHPLYAFLRRSGYDADLALDLTQDYFATLLEKRFLDDVDPERGRFRSFLLATLKHHVTHVHDRERAAKRGGGRTVLSLDTAEAEQRYRMEPVEATTPENVYERCWADTVVRRARERLRDEMEAAGKGATYHALEELVTFGTAARSQREIGAELGISEAAVGMALQRLRRRLGRILREQVAETVDDPEAIDGELRHLLQVLRES
jgi:RNA polymerase sigma factor (sigma-70 family)